jgi:hypothetical protein
MIRNWAIVLLYAGIGWAICASIMGIGMMYLPMDIVLYIHAIGGSLAFYFLSYHYHKHFRYTEPRQTALIFVSFIVLVDFFIVALAINHSLDMFKSVLGTWIPFGLIYLSTYFAGLKAQKTQ